MAEHTSEKKSKKAPKHIKAELSEELGREGASPAPHSADHDRAPEHDNHTARKNGAEKNEAHHSRQKKTAGKKGGGFPVGGLLFMFLLLAVILAAVYFGMEYMSRFEQLKGEYDGAILAASVERDAARALYDEADPDSAENAARRREATDALIAGANAELDALREQSEATESAIRAAEEKLGELQDLEDYDYYRSIYDEYVEGRAYVEGLLSGN